MIPRPVFHDAGMQRTTVKPKDSPIRLVSMFAAAVVAIVPRTLQAQCPNADSARGVSQRRLPFVGSAADDSARTGVLIGACWGYGTLIRSSFSIARPGKDSGRLTVLPIDPVVTTVWNSTIPVSLNDGPMWAGRGWNTATMFGIRAAYRNFRLVIAPQLVTAANTSFPIVSSGNPVRSSFASPFHSGNFSADLPLRFGDRPYTRIDPGETSIQLIVRGLAVGATSASLWWGPGIRNALVMSNNAPGIPQVFLRTARPIRTRVADIEAHWLLGGLTESPFFDGDARNDQRSLSAAIVTLRVAADTGVTIGAARSVFAVAKNFGRLPGHWADVLIDWHRPTTVGSPNDPSDQMFSLFGRWIIPSAGLEAHLEWAKLQPPKSLREVFVEPQRSQGFTLGLSWARALSSVSLLRVQTEATMLEQTPPSPGAEIPQLYASHAVPQGYTQQGQVIGAAIGPGSSSQYLGIDLLHKNWQLGGSVGRIRWEDDAYYRSFPARVTHYGHDVSLFASLQARWDSRCLAAEATLTRTNRLSYLFQTINPYDRSETAFDVRNSTLSLRLTPHM